MVVGPIFLSLSLSLSPLCSPPLVGEEDMVADFLGWGNLVVESRPLLSSEGRGEEEEEKCFLCPLYAGPVGSCGVGDDGKKEC